MLKTSRSISKQFLFKLLFLSSVITLFLTSYQLYENYTYEKATIKNKFKEIKRIHIPSLKNNIWVLDKDLVLLELKGILDMDYVKFVEFEGPSFQKISRGVFDDRPETLSKTYNLKYSDGNESHTLGKLKVIISTQILKERVLERSFFILISQSLKTFIVSFFILLIFRKLVNIPLIRLSDRIKELSLADIVDIDKEALDNVANESSGDEFEQVHNIFNQMEARIIREAELFNNSQKEKLKLQNEVNQKLRLEALGTLAGGIAHDFNNILQVLMGSLETIKGANDDKPLIEKQIDLSEKSCQRAKELVERILLFSRKGDEKDFHPFNINEIIIESVEFLKTSKPKNVEITFSNQLKNITVAYGSPVQIQQVFINLVINSFHALGSKGGNVKATIALVDDQFQILVEDDGPGIPASIRNKIFDPFYTTKDVGKGVGLGLSTALGIITNHNGTIKLVQEHSPGAKFEILIPSYKGVSPTKESISAPKLSIPFKRLLIVDDEENLLPLYESYFEKRGIETVTFSRPKEILEYFYEGNTGDIVLTDYQLPEMSGVDLSNRLKEIDPNLKIVMISGHLDDSIKSTEGINAFLSKPCRAASILDTLISTYQSHS